MSTGINYLHALLSCSGAREVSACSFLIGFQGRMSIESPDSHCLAALVVRDLHPTEQERVVDLSPFYDVMRPLSRKPVTLLLLAAGVLEPSFIAVGRLQMQSCTIKLLGSLTKLHHQNQWDSRVCIPQYSFAVPQIPAENQSPKMFVFKACFSVATNRAMNTHSIDRNEGMTPH